MEEAYAVPARQHDLQRLRERLGRLVAGHDLLEVACGTGYWTQVMAATARHILATDISEAMLALARAKAYGPGRVELAQADAWHLEALSGPFTAGAALFWWSHMPKSSIRPFLDQLHRVLPSHAPVIFVDNLPSDCRWTPVVRIDTEGNTYQRRVLRTGEEFQIIKNYPSEAELRATVAELAEAVEYTAFTCVWVMSYLTR
jgi:demethylmenaquinone methyltransferase/2-methoxy-6-polyprenyl-1,4-benzoquinol methylase